MDVNTAKTCSTVRDRGRIYCGRFVCTATMVLHYAFAKAHYEVSLVTVITITCTKIDGFGPDVVFSYTPVSNYLYRWILLLWS